MIPLRLLMMFVTTFVVTCYDIDDDDVVCHATPRYDTIAPLPPMLLVAF